MKYYKYQDEESLIGSGIRYLEAEDGRSFREVTVSDGNYLSSNLKYPHWGMMMSEGLIDYDSIEEVTEIEREEFDTVWNSNLAQNAGRWLIAKLAYPVGAHVKGHISVFYPQGVVVDFGDAVLGVADYDECRASTERECLYPRHTLLGVVGAHDEQNQWLVLSSPRVLRERIPDA